MSDTWTKDTVKKKIYKAAIDLLLKQLEKDKLERLYIKDHDVFCDDIIYDEDVINSIIGNTDYCVTRGFLLLKKDIKTLKFRS